MERNGGLLSKLKDQALAPPKQCRKGQPGKARERVRCEEDCCEHTSTSNFDLKRHHKSVHLKLMEHKCAICLKEFSDHYNLKRHEWTHLLAEKDYPYPCSVCERRFKRTDARYNHTVTKHPFDPNQIKFECQICSKSFFYQDALRSHKHTHNVDIKCRYCEAKFKQFGKRKKHEEEFHQIQKTAAAASSSSSSASSNV